MGGASLGQIQTNIQYMVRLMDRAASKDGPDLVQEEDEPQDKEGILAHVLELKKMVGMMADQVTMSKAVMAPIKEGEVKIIEIEKNMKCSYTSMQVIGADRGTESAT